VPAWDWLFQVSCFRFQGQRSFQFSVFGFQEHRVGLSDRVQASDGPVQLGGSHGHPSPCSQELSPGRVGAWRRRSEPKATQNLRLLARALLPTFQAIVKSRSPESGRSPRGETLFAPQGRGFQVSGEAKFSVFSVQQRRVGLLTGFRHQTVRLRSVGATATQAHAVKHEPRQGGSPAPTVGAESHPKPPRVCKSAFAYFSGDCEK
jgi:hypothetical protein